MKFLMIFFTILSLAFISCSNSASIDNNQDIYSMANCDDTIQDFNYPQENTKKEPDSNENSIEAIQQNNCDSIINYLPLNDIEYPYVGIPRIVIETNNRQQIKDKEKEVPAKLQIWGKNAPESEIMNLTIKGRGNSTWKKPKKPYTIQFEEKTTFMGMKKAKKWILLANYFDRTLLRNATAFEIARKTQLDWTPNGKFAEVFLNGVFLGNYYVCEKIQINKNRLNISEDSFLLEFDVNYDEEYKFKTSYKNFPVNIKKPNVPSKEQQNYIQSYIDSVESILYSKTNSHSIEEYIDIQSFVDYLIVYELTQNYEIYHPKSAFMYKDNNLLKAGPVWDFDWATFIARKKNWGSKKSLWFDSLMTNEKFKESLKSCWKLYITEFMEIPIYIDSLADYIKISNERNASLWPISASAYDFPDKNENFETAISMMKSAYSQRLTELDSLINAL